MGSPACRGEYGRYLPESLTERGESGWFETTLSEVWTVDYRVRQMFESSTSYEFGNPAWAPPGVYAPLSKLDFELDSPWHGLQIGVELPGWRAHFEWLMPMRQNIDGCMADYDWNIDEPRDDPTRLDSLTLSSERWSDGQMLEPGDGIPFDRFLSWLASGTLADGGIPISAVRCYGLRHNRARSGAWAIAGV